MAGPRRSTTPPSPANAILALYTDRRYTADNGDETVLPTEYGFTAE